MHNLIFIQGLRIKGLLDDDRVMEIGIGRKEDGTESRGVMSDEKSSETVNVITVIAVPRRHHYPSSAGGRGQRRRSSSAAAAASRGEREKEKISRLLLFTPTNLRISILLPA